MLCLRQHTPLDSSNIPMVTGGSPLKPYHLSPGWSLRGALTAPSDLTCRQHPSTYAGWAISAGHMLGKQGCRALLAVTASQTALQASLQAHVHQCIHV